MPPVVSTSARAVGELDDRGRDLAGLVGHDAALDLVAVGGEQLLERVAARSSRVPCETPSETVSTAAFTPSTFVFSTSVTSAIIISLSIAFAMS